MKKFSFLFIPVFCYFFSLNSCVKDRVQQPSITPPDTSLGSRVLIDYWNFNSNDTVQMLMPNIANGAASISYIASYYDAVTPGSTYNLMNNDTAGNGLRMRNPFTSITFNLPTTGYKEPLLIYSAERSSNGPTINTISYTVDGTNFITDGLNQTSFSMDTVWAVYSIDFSSIPGATNNPNFAVQFVTSNNNTGTSGNDRYDNVALDAYKQ